jgi:hypothetical protein
MPLLLLLLLPLLLFADLCWCSRCGKISGSKYSRKSDKCLWFPWIPTVDGYIHVIVRCTMMMLL